MRPGRLLLLGKGLHANLLVLAAKDAVEHTALVLDTVPQRQVLALVDNLLAAQNSDLGVARNRLGRLERRLHQLLVRGEHASSHTPLTGLLTGEGLAGQDQLHGASLADSTGQTLATASTGDGAELDLGLAKVGRLGAVEGVAHESQLAAAAQSVAGDSSDNGLLDAGGHVGPRLDKGIGVGLGEGQGSHLLDVGAGGEGALRARQDNGEDAVGVVELAEGLVEFGDEGRAQGVEGLGAVQGDCKGC